MYDKQKVIDIALAEVGYLEKASKTALDDKTANAGSKNYTKYARDLDAIGFFNGRKQGFAWCAVFVCWIYKQAYDVEGAKKLLYLPSKSANNCAAGCRYLRNYFKNKGRLFDKPEVGDVIFFYSADKSQIAHTGIVYKVDSKKVYTIEGNTSGFSGVIANGGGVCKKSYSLTYGRLAGFGRPALYAENSPVDASLEKDREIVAETPKTAQNANLAGLTVTVELSLLSKGDKGAQVKTVQRLLNAIGYNCGSVDGVIGNHTEAAIKVYQADKKLDPDGKVGAKTWGALLK